MVKESKVINWTQGAILLVVLISAIAVILPTVDTGAAKMSDEERCGTATGIYNTSNAITCHTAANSSVAVSYLSLPLSGLFATGGVMILIIIAAFLIITIGSAFKTGKK